MLNSLWQKSTKSGPWTDNCVEARVAGNGIEMRNSRTPDGATLRFTPDEWNAFLGGVRNGEFDLAE